MTNEVPLDAPAYLLKGDDDVLLQERVLSLVHELVGHGDRGLMVEELDIGRYEGDGGDPHIARLVDAAQTPPFLTERRVVVARHLAVFASNEAVAPLVSYLQDPLPTTSLVLVWERSPKPGARLGRVPTKLAEAVGRSGGHALDTGVGAGKARDQWIDDQVSRAGIRLAPAARQAVAAQIGEDNGLLVGLLQTLTAVFGSGSRLDIEDIEPYLGQQGGVKPYELTDAIDAGDVTAALDRLQRLLVGSGWHPLQVMATLTNHYLRMMALDGSGVGDERAAAELLGMKGSTFPARKALNQARRMGSGRLVELTSLLAQADVDLRGGKAWPPELVVEVLVARLASRTPRSKPTRNGSSPSGSSRRR